MARKPSKKMLIKLIQDNGGIITDIAKACKVSRQSVYKWIEDDETLNQLISESRDLLVDLAKSGLKYHLEEKSEKSIHFTLDRLARKDGFGKMIQVHDTSKFEDSLNSKSDEELFEILNNVNNKLK